MRYEVISYYVLTPLQDPEGERLQHLAYFEGRDVKGRIYFTGQGINAQLTIAPHDGIAYAAWVKERFPGVDFKIQKSDSHAFPRLQMKTKKQLVAFDLEVDLNNRADVMAPEEFADFIERRAPGTLLIDVRNDYEWRIGHFKGAELPSLEQFRHFPAYAQKLKAEVDPETKIAMCCTGGIRCELFSAYLKQIGFKHLFQLKGGILGYAEKMGSHLWTGKLFVFDDRLAVPLGEEEKVVGECLHCKAACDVYYNCANMDCNELFLSCPSCAAALVGCCSHSCVGAERVRPYLRLGKPKPFRRAHNYVDNPSASCVLGGYGSDRSAEAPPTPL